MHRRKATTEISASTDSLPSEFVNSYAPSHEPTSTSLRDNNTVVFLSFAERNISGYNDIGKNHIELRQDICPLSCQKFLTLIRGNLGTVNGIPYTFKNTRIHRIFKGVILQGGALKDQFGEASHSIYNGGGYFKDENFVLRHVGMGRISYEKICISNYTEWR